MKGSRKRKFYKSYRGYIMTHMGPKADDAGLQKLAGEITGKQV